MPWINLIELLWANPPTEKEVKQIFENRKRRAKPTFYTDENFPPVAIQLLRSLGARVRTTQDSRLKGHPDENHAAYALRNGYILLTRDRDYLNERRFPLIHCPTIVVFDFRSGSREEIRQSFICLRRILSMPQFFDKWTKIDANPESWTEYARFLDGSKSRSRMRVHNGNIQKWLD